MFLIYRFPLISSAGLIVFLFSRGTSSPSLAPLSKKKSLPTKIQQNWTKRQNELPSPNNRKIPDKPPDRGFTFFMRMLRLSEAFLTNGDFLESVELSLSLRLI